MKKLGWLIAALAGGTLLWLRQRSQKSVDHLPYANQIKQAARDHNLDPALIASIISIETNFGRAGLIGDNGTSYGLMQVNCTPNMTGAISTARMMGYSGPCDGLLDPVVGIDIGAKYLQDRIARFGISDGILAYNTGTPYFRDQRGRKVRKTRNNNYDQRVKQFWRTL